MAYNLILWWARLFLRLYFRRTIVIGRDQIPPEGPLIVASNHPSAFMEASVLATVLGRQLHFLVRGDVFNPRFRWLFRWTNQIPIYRQKDGISNLRKNASSFDLTYQRLADRHAVLIFPEAKTTLEKKMRPIQRGTAHLAFGTLPAMKEGEKLLVLPVGVNFMEPRIPGTDVVVRFGQPFITPDATREDRDAIEQFTETLSDAMSPLILQVHEHGYEKHFDVLASVYLKIIERGKSNMAIHDDLKQIEGLVNAHEKHKELLIEVHDYIHQLKRHKAAEAIYYPNIVRTNRLLLCVLLLLKMTWWLAGGWIWRGMRYFIFSKLRTDTFQGPTSVGAAMVLYPLISVILFLFTWIVGWPLWLVPAWLAILAMGKMIPFPLALVWKLLILRPSLKKSLDHKIRDFTRVIRNMTGQPV